jgi:hypothetical protein
MQATRLDIQDISSWIVIYHSFRKKEKSEEDRFGEMPKINDENPLRIL